MLTSLILAAAAPSAAQTPAAEAIVVTASREPVAAESVTIPVTVVSHEERVGDSVGLPFVADVLRLTPGVSVAVSGPRGSLTQLRIRGAEANHTLLFVDGIRFNDPAAGNEARFELFASEAVLRVDILRGPQSALWGSEALGGVIAAYTDDDHEPGLALRSLAEHGGLDTSRLSGQFALASKSASVSGGGGWMRSDGIDAFAGGADERDGFGHRFAHVRATARPDAESEIGIVSHWMEGRSAYDGFDPVTFRRGDTADETHNRIFAVRGWARTEQGGWTLALDGSLLDSANRNRLGEAPLNSSFGRRFTASAQLSRQLGGHRLTAAAERQGEDFRARDQVHFGGTDQDRSRELTAFVGEWFAEWSEALTTDVAVRRDGFSAFPDATTIRASAVFRPTERLDLLAAYGEGVAQPTFYDLYGFFPGSFTGNPALRPERAKEWSAGARWQARHNLRLLLTAFTARLEDEIVDVFDPTTFRSTTANATGTSRRRGIEAEAELRLSRRTRLRANYTFLDAEERQVEGGVGVKEARRPRHSAALWANGTTGAVQWDTGLAYAGKRRDTDFEAFPTRTVTLDDYVLVSFRLGYQFSRGLEAFARAENAFDADYQDVVGYETAGRTVHAGIRLRFGD